MAGRYPAYYNGYLLINKLSKNTTKVNYSLSFALAAVAVCPAAALSALKNFLRAMFSCELHCV